jgi:hypothetical protein
MGSLFPEKCLEMKVEAVKFWNEHSEHSPSDVTVANLEKTTLLPPPPPSKLHKSSASLY